MNLFSRSVTADLVQKAVLSLTRAITHKLQPYTVNVTMLFYKGLFADENMKSIVTGNHLSLCVREPTIWVPTRFDTNRAVQSQKMARGWKFWI